MKSAPDLSRTLSDLNSNFPGIVSGTPPQTLPISTEIAALVRGGAIAQGDLIAKITDLDAKFASLRANTQITLSPLNGFTMASGNFYAIISELLITVVLVGTAPIAAQGLKVCDLPYPVARANLVYNQGTDSRIFYTVGSALYTTTNGVANDSFNTSGLLMRI
jgi:hypothetical protein